MPTGYTAPIYDGKDITFQAFAWNCARAFSALIMMRDDASDAPIATVQKPDEYHVKQGVLAATRLREALAMTLAEAEVASAKQHALLMAEHAESRLKNEAMLNRYRVMIGQVEDWTPPTAQHEGLKKFMLEQLRSSVEHDCHDWPAPKDQTAQSWLDERIKSARRDVAYHAEHHAQEVARCEERTAWIQGLIASIGQPPQNKAL